MIPGQGFSDIRGATVVFAAQTKGLNKYIFTVSTPGGEDLKIRIHEDDQADEKVKKVNSFWHEKVNLTIYGSPWTAGDKSGITNYLQSIERSYE